MLKLLCVVLSSMLVVSDCYKVLLVFSLPSKSHKFLGNGFVQHLLKAGHEVTFITPDLVKDPHPRLKQIDVSFTYNFFGEDTDSTINMTNMVESNGNQMMSTYEMFDLMFLIAKATLLSDGVQALLKDRSQEFDVVIAEWVFSDLYSGFSAIYDCPLIWFNSLEPYSTILRLIDEGTNPAYTADIVSDCPLPMTFTHRVNELWIQIKTLAMVKQIQAVMDVHRIFNIFENPVYLEGYGPAAALRGKTLPSLDEVRYNASLVLGNSIQPLSPSIKLPANYKEIGGYYIDTHNPPMPENIKKIMDGAKDGVIYFSLGSNVKSKYFPDKLKREFLKIFGGLKQEVLWKFEEDLSDLPKNVHILQWAPQTAILGHKNCILFITHGGLLSTTEAIHFGVPVIGIPVFVDQHTNVNKAVSKGFGLRVDLGMDMGKYLDEALHRILSDGSYRQKAKEMSLIFHDRQQTTGQELIHWVEHVVKTRGAPHLRSPALLVPLYQKLYLDLIALVIVILYVVKKIACVLLCSNKKKNTVGKKKKE